MIACGTCKQLNDETARVCRFCGTNLLYGNPVQQKRPDYAPPRPEPRPYAPPQPQPAPLPPPAPMAPYYAPPVMPQPPMGYYRCPRCSSTQPPQLISKMSQEGLIVLIAMIVFCFPLFWIGFLIKEEVRICPNCGMKVG